MLDRQVANMCHPKYSFNKQMAVQIYIHTYICIYRERERERERERGRGMNIVMRSTNNEGSFSYYWLLVIINIFLSSFSHNLQTPQPNPFMTDYK